VRRCTWRRAAGAQGEQQGARCGDKYEQHCHAAAREAPDRSRDDVEQGRAALEGANGGASVTGQAASKLSPSLPSTPVRVRAPKVVRGSHGQRLLRVTGLGLHDAMLLRLSA
jgi:hypothetical protein